MNLSLIKIDIIKIIIKFVFFSICNLERFSSIPSKRSIVLVEPLHRHN